MPEPKAARTVAPTDPAGRSTTQPAAAPSRVAKTAPIVSAADPDAQPEATVSVPVWADDLVAALAKTGTGAGKLAVIARAKADRFAEFADLEPNDPKRHLTARQALKALCTDPEVSELTKNKARQICRTGQYVPAAVGPVAIDAHVPPPPDAPAPDDDSDEDDTDEWLNDDAGTEAGDAAEPGRGDELDDDPEPGDDETDPVAVPDAQLDGLTVAQLREVAAGENVKLTSDAKKGDIVQAIRDARASRAAQ